MPSNSKDMQKRFEEDTRGHSMKIHHDDGIYRHVEFSRNGSSIYRFDLVTWPGYLSVSGDMGEWVFTRIHDMFDFFVSRDAGINPRYWSEKLAMGAGGSGRDKHCLEFDDDAFAKELDEWHESWLEDEEHDANEIEDVKQRISELKREHFSDSQEAYNAVFESDIPGLYAYELFESNSCERYSHHYLWICYAVAWGIERYKGQRLANKAIDKFLSIRGV